MRPVYSDTGSATVWWVSLSLLLWFLTLAVAMTAAARLDRDRAATAADLAALAAADRAAHGTHMACGPARITAEANDASLITCDLTGHIVDVVVTVPSTVLDHQVHARARAGPVHKADPPEEEE